MSAFGRMGDHRPTADYIAFHARRRPDRQAVAGTFEASYAELDIHVGRITAALETLGLAPGSFVALAHDDHYALLVLAISFESLGIAVCLFSGVDTVSVGPLLDQAALVVLSERILPGRHDRVLRADDAWLHAAVTRERAAGKRARREVPAQAPIVLLCSSGTTGSPKVIPLTATALDRRVRQRTMLLGLGRDARCLITTHLKVGGSFYNLVACLRLGATLILPNSMILPRDFVEHRATHATLLPFMLSRLLAEWPDDVAPLNGLTFCVIGARLPAELRASAMKRTGGRIISLYSSSEAGGIAVIDSDGAGRVLPGSEVSVVGPDGAPAGTGQVGAIRVRGDAAIAPRETMRALSQEPLHHGWLDTDDFGTWAIDGRLRVLGRCDDVINVAGVKVAAPDLDARIQRITGLSDVAVFAIEDGEDRSVLVVCNAGGVTCDVRARLDAAGLLVAAPIILADVGVIPRTQEGKVRRATLRQMVMPGIAGMFATSLARSAT